MDDWLTLKETCKFLDLAPNTVYKLVRTGRLRAFEIKGVRGLKFKKADVEAILTQVEAIPAKTAIKSKVRRGRGE